MAISDAKKRKIGVQLIDWIYLGIRTGARRSVEEYQRLKATDPAEAEQHLARACNMPMRRRAVINAIIERYESRNGAGTAPAYLNECLALTGTSITVADLNAELTSLENYANTLIDAKIAGTMTLDNIAADIESKVEWEASDWSPSIDFSVVDRW